MGAIGATISGAGPTVLVWSFWQSTGGVMKELNERVGDWAEVRRVPFSPDGRGRAGAVSAERDNSLSLWSEDSFLSIALQGLGSLDRIGRLVRLDRVDRVGRFCFLGRLRRIRGLGHVVGLGGLGALGAGPRLDPG